MVQPHKHYLGAAHSFEIIKPTDATAGKFVRPGITILKTFFINDKVNVNDWQATWEGLKEDAKELPGVPLVLQEDLEHPKFSVQEMFDRGTIFDYDIDEEKHQIIVYVRVTDPTIVERIKSGELQYVSPAVIPRGSETMHNEDGVDILDRTLPLHLAIVRDPAYGKDAAKMTHLCSGDGEECYHRLKMMTASRQIFSAADECVERKIKILADEHKDWKHDQVVAVAFSYCKEKKADSAEQVVGPLTQTPLIKKMLGTTARIASTLLKIKTGSKYHIHKGVEGYWINVQDMDVFIARNQTIKSAMLEQCGCTKLGSTEGKISQEKANYHKTDSEAKNCEHCKFFRPEDNYCEVVSGFIEPYHVSDLFQPKK